MNDLKSLVAAKKDEAEKRRTAEQIEIERVRAYKLERRKTLYSTLSTMLMAEVDGNFGLTVHLIEPDYSGFYTRVAYFTRKPREFEKDVTEINMGAVCLAWTTETEKYEDYPSQSFDVLVIYFMSVNIGQFAACGKPFELGNVSFQAKDVESFRERLAEWVFNNSRWLTA